MIGMNRRMELKDFVLSSHRDINLVADTSQLAAVAVAVVVVAPLSVYLLEKIHYVSFVVETMKEIVLGVVDCNSSNFDYLQEKEKEKHKSLIL